jgi:hypothetical protein
MLGVTTRRCKPREKIGLKHNNILADGFRKNHRNPSGDTIKAQCTETIGVAPLKKKGQVHSDPVKKATNSA